MYGPKFGLPALEMQWGSPYALTGQLSSVVYGDLIANINHYIVSSFWCHVNNNEQRTWSFHGEDTELSEHAAVDWKFWQGWFKVRAELGLHSRIPHSTQFGGLVNLYLGCFQVYICSNEKIN
jgi:hypothetical protein